MEQHDLHAVALRNCIAINAPNVLHVAARLCSNSVKDPDAEELLGAARDHDSFRKKILGTNLFVGNTLFMRVLKEQFQRRPILLDAVGKEVVSERTLDGGRMVG